MLNIDFNSNNSIPKYRQIIDTILQLIRLGTLQKGDKLPSCNELRKQYGLSQDTVYLAYNQLKSLGIVSSQVGKGYFVQSTNVDNNHKVFVLFDNLSAYKEELYESFKMDMKGKGSEQIFFHHNNHAVFKSLIENAVGEFTDFVIMPIDEKSCTETLESLPINKVYLLDKASKKLKQSYSYVCQNFEKDIYDTISQNKHIFLKYNRLILVTEHHRNHFKEIINGFRLASKQLNIPCNVIFKSTNLQLQKGDAYFVVEDIDLVNVVCSAERLNFELGKDIGVISYNETPLKQIAAGGITAISTDFRAMGKSVAEMILSGKKQKIHNPFGIIVRKSI